MLGQLGRWLRAAGYDTIIAAERTSDRALLTRARADGRVLLTRDRRLFEIRDAAQHAVLLRGEGIEALVAEITPRFGIDWLARPFSRCLICNAALRPAPLLARSGLPPTVRAEFGDINQCPQCDRLYWPGGHVRRMTQRLARWREGNFT